MKITLSPRLLACSEYINPGERVADVGCDHGYLGIYLLTQKQAGHIYAADINEGPLQSAVNNARRYCVEEKISFFLSNGLQNVPRDFDCAVCAGMGADTIISIIEAAPWLRKSTYRLILQCQSKTHTLRQYLSNNGWHIVREKAVEDGRFLYTVMEVLYENAPPLSPGECWFSTVMHPDEMAEKYYNQTLFRLKRAIDGQGEKADSKLVQAYNQLIAQKGG